MEIYRYSFLSITSIPKTAKFSYENKTVFKLCDNNKYPLYYSGNLQSHLYSTHFGKVVHVYWVTKWQTYFLSKAFSNAYFVFAIVLIANILVK
jgi:hypothetical protein